jgi:hypothetical protein
MADAKISGEGELQRVTRPRGVWILTIWAGLFGGLLPVASVIFFYFSPEAQAAYEMSLLVLLLSVLLGLAILAAAVGAWWGNNRARIALVVLITIHYGLLAFNNISLISSGVSLGTAEAEAWGRALRSLITIGIYLWYFLGERPRAYYAQQ